MVFQTLCFTLLQPVGTSLMHAIKEGLRRDFNEEVQRAWEAVFQVVASTMSDVLPNNSLTEEKKRLVRDSWKRLSVEPTKHGAVMFTRYACRVDAKKEKKILPCA